MKTAYLGEGPSRQVSPIKFVLAAMAMAFLPLGAMAQPAPQTPPDATTPAPTDVPTLPIEDVAPPAEPAAAAPADAAPA